MKNEGMKDRMRKNIKINIICLIISFLWIGLGTFLQISAYPPYNYFRLDYSYLYYILYLVTLPSNILLSGMLFTEPLKDICTYVILLQSVKLLIYWWFFYTIYRIFKKRRTKKEILSNNQINK